MEGVGGGEAKATQREIFISKFQIRQRNKLLQLRKLPVPKEVIVDVVIYTRQAASRHLAQPANAFYSENDHSLQSRPTRRLVVERTENNGRHDRPISWAKLTVSAG